MDGRVATAATISFFVGKIVLLVAVLVTHEGTPTLADLSGTMVGVDRGLSRGDLRSSLHRSIPRLGAVTTIGFIISGQVLAPTILDQFGLLNLPVHPVTPPRLGGAILAVTDAISCYAPDHNPLWLSNFTLSFPPLTDYIRAVSSRRLEDR